MSKKIVIAFITSLAAGLANAAGSFADSDINQDGYITAEEAAATAKGLSGQMESLDVDKNGKLDEAEFSKFEIVVPNAVSDLPE